MKNHWKTTLAALASGLLGFKLGEKKGNVWNQFSNEFSNEKVADRIREILAQQKFNQTTTAPDYTKLSSECIGSLEQSNNASVVFFEVLIQAYEEMEGVSLKDAADADEVKEDPSLHLKKAESTASAALDMINDMADNKMPEEVSSKLGYLYTTKDLERRLNIDKLAKRDKVDIPNSLPESAYTMIEETLLPLLLFTLKRKDPEAVNDVLSFLPKAELTLAKWIEQGRPEVFTRILYITVKFARNPRDPEDDPYLAPLLPMLAKNFGKF